jgi:hypothetical protein
MQDPDRVCRLGQLWQTVTVEKLIIIPSLQSGRTFSSLADYTDSFTGILSNMPARDSLNHPFNLKPAGTGPFT